MSICNNCKEDGAHFVPPSFGEEGFYHCEPAIPYSKYKELERQLTNYKETIDRRGRSIEELNKQLAESVHKSKLREIMSAKKTTNFPDSRKKIIENIGKLLTPPAKEN